MGKKHKPKYIKIMGNLGSKQQQSASRGTTSSTKDTPAKHVGATKATAAGSPQANSTIRPKHEPEEDLQRSLQRSLQRLPAGTRVSATSRPTPAAAVAGNGVRATPVLATEEPATPSAKPKTEKKFDVRADNDSSDEDEESDDVDSDDDRAPNTDFFDRLNGTITETPASTRNGITSSKRAPRGKEEEVADSDTERAATKAKPTANGAATADTTSSSGESDDDSSASESDDSDDGEEEAAKPAKAVNKTTAKKVSSSEDTSSSEEESEADKESESESDSDSDADAGTKKAAKSLMNGSKAAAKDAASTSSSEESSEDTSSDEEEETPVPKKTAPKPVAKTTTKSAETVETTSSEEESGSESDSADKEESQAGALVSGRQNTSIVPSAFVGNDFVLRRVQGESDGKDVADFLSQAKLEGKQLWYFTAPASVPINVIEKLEVPVSKITNGEPVFEHDGADYALNLSREAAANASYQVLIPNKKGTQYQPVSRDVDQVMRIKRVIQLSSSATAPGLPRAPRAQPKGLQARFRPLGVPPTQPMGTIGSSSDEDSDVEMAEAPAPNSSSKKPQAKASKKTKKVTSSDESSSEPTLVQATPAKKKASKRKHNEDDDVEDLASTQLMQEEQSAEKKKTKKQKRSEDVLSTPKPSSSKVTPVAPPSVPISSQKRKLPEPSSPELPTPAPKSSKKNKRVSFSAEPSSSQAVPKESPVPLPSVGRKSAVPVPHVPHSKSAITLPPSMSVSVDSTPKPKKEKKKKIKDGLLSSSQASVSTPKQTPVAPPKIGSSKSKK